jgi:hypothetical protein
VRVHSESAGDGDTLLLAARQLRREEVHALGEPDLRQLFDSDAYEALSSGFPSTIVIATAVYPRDGEDPITVGKEIRTVVYDLWDEQYIIRVDGAGGRETKKVKYPETFPHAEIITFEFPERGGMPPLQLFWYDGGLLPPRPEGLDVSERAPTNYYVGDQGVLIPVRRRQPGTRPQGAQAAVVEAPAGPPANFLVLANGRPKEFTPPPKTVPRTIGHYQEWIAAAKGGKPANCNFDYACLFAETSLLGVIAVRTGKDLLYDAQNVRFTNDADANQYIDPPYRTGWSL